MINEELMQYLRCRESVIANHAWRDRDADGQLQALREVSEQISAWAAEHGAQADARLRHYLANASYAKALAHLEQESGG